MNFGLGLDRIPNNFWNDSEYTSTIYIMYLCKVAFSVLQITKSKYQSTLKNVEDTPHSPVSNILPRFNSSFKNKQAYPSH